MTPSIKYVHEQAVPMQEWHIHHGLGTTQVVVTAFTPEGRPLTIPPWHPTVFHESPDVTILRFKPGPVAGSATVIA